MKEKINWVGCCTVKLKLEKQGEQKLIKDTQAVFINKTSVSLLSRLINNYTYSIVHGNVINCTKTCKNNTKYKKLIQIEK